MGYHVIFLKQQQEEGVKGYKSIQWERIKKQMRANLSRALALFALLGLNHAISLEAEQKNSPTISDVQTLTSSDKVFNIPEPSADLIAETPSSGFDDYDEGEIGIETPEHSGHRCHSCDNHCPPLNCDLRDCLRRRCPVPNVPDAEFEECKECPKRRCFNTKYEDKFCLEGKSQTKLPKQDIITDQITNTEGTSVTGNRICGCGEIKKNFKIHGNICVTEDIEKKICDGNKAHTDSAFNKVTKTRHCTEGPGSKCKNLCDCNHVCHACNGTVDGVDG